MKERFKNIKLGTMRMAMVRQANAIIDELRAMGYTLTLRQLYYQLVARDIIPNRQTEYKRLGDILNDARLGGYVDWDAIEDRTRNLQGVNHWKDPSEIMGSAAQSFRIDKWADQDYHVEVWVEKDALVGVLEKACRPLDVNWFSCRGYTSQSELYGAGKRLQYYARKGQTPVIIHLGDHDPSGKDMTRDIEERLMMFAERYVKVERIALNMDQIDEYSPPPNPAKVTDSRFEKYAEEFGEESWELDALNPRILDDLITRTVVQYLDQDRWDAAVTHEREQRALLRKAEAHWNRVAKVLHKRDDPKPEEPPRNIFDLDESESDQPNDD
jgi:hypothetical protein